MPRYTLNIRVTVGVPGLGYWDFITRHVEAPTIGQAQESAQKALGNAFLAFGSWTSDGPETVTLPTSAEITIKQ